MWAHRVCLLVPVEGIAPGAIRMCDLLGGCWEGLRHTPSAALRLTD